MPTLCQPTNDLLITSVLSGSDVNFKHLTSVWKVCWLNSLLELENVFFLSSSFHTYHSTGIYQKLLIINNVNINVPNVHIIPYTIL